MADLIITEANTIPVAGFTFHDGTSGEDIDTGEVCYIDTANSNVLKLAQADGTALEATVKGIATHKSLSGQPLRLITAGSLGFGAILTAAVEYYLSETAGKIAVRADLTSSSYVVRLGTASTTSNLVQVIDNTGVQVP